MDLEVSEVLLVEIQNMYSTLQVSCLVFLKLFSQNSRLVCPSSTEIIRKL